MASRAVTVLPYHGPEPGLSVLLLTSTRGGNVRTEYVLDNKVFRVAELAVDRIDAGSIAALPPYDVVFNAIGDADINLDMLAAAQGVVAQLTAPVLNRPEVVMGTGRGDTRYRLGHLEGVIVPITEQVDRSMLSGAGVHAALADLGLGFPFLLRPPGFHTGQHFNKVDDIPTLEKALRDGFFNEFLAIQYFDYRSQDGYFRKYRAMFIDGQIYPLHLALARHWKIHYFSADMKGNEANKAEERRFLEDMPGVLGERGMAALIGIERHLGLDYGGIDFGLTPAGDIIVFEANANMLIHLADDGVEFPYRARHVPMVAAAFQTMLHSRANR